ncbi:ammonium transporter, partial [Acinetobacter baumannii]
MKKMLMALSLTGALLGGTAAWAEETVTTPTSEVTATSTSEAPATIAAAPAAEETLAAPTPTAKLDTGDTSWILISTALVLLMTIPGLALFYG